MGYIKKIEMLIQKHILGNTVRESLFYSKGRLNIGDSMNPWLIQSIRNGKEISYSNPMNASGPHLFAIGSILEYANENCDVWGSGYISSVKRVKARPQSILAVRGKLTRNLLTSQGINCPEIYGDPALLTPNFCKKKYVPEVGKIGILPHYVDKSFVLNSSLLSADNVELIDVETDNIDDFTNSLLSCEIVVSSSLHGLIIAEAYGVPVVWMRCSDKVVGGVFKFLDYFSATNRKPDYVSLDELKSLKTIEPASLREVQTLQSDLLGNFPLRYL